MKRMKKLAVQLFVMGVFISSYVVPVLAGDGGGL